MKSELLDLVLRHADRLADQDGVAPTPIPGLVAIRATERSALSYQIARPLA